MMEIREAIEIISMNPVWYANSDDQGVWDEAIHKALSAMEEQLKIEQACRVLAELFDSPCNYSPIDETMILSEKCSDDCGTLANWECWKRFFETVSE